MSKTPPLLTSREVLRRKCPGLKHDTEAWESYGIGRGALKTGRNFGIDLGLFDNRIDLQVDYFNNQRKAILLQRNTVSNVTGFQQMPWQNFGIVKNQGVDASLNLNYKVGEVNLSARGNFTFARNEIREYDQVPQAYPRLEKKATRLNSWKL